MNKSKFVAIVSVMAAFSTQVVAADGYRPQNDAQRNYKACPADIMAKGVELVVPLCGTLPDRPKFPDYDTAWSSKLSSSELDLFSAKLHQFKTQVAQYQTCINYRVMGDGSLPTETLNYAACADQWAVEQKAQSAEEWGDSCLGQNDWEHPKGAAFPTHCYAEEE